MPLPDYFNQSQYACWSRCKKEYEVRYVRGLTVRAVPEYFRLGTAVHRGLMAGLRGNSIEEEIVKWGGEVIALGISTEQAQTLEEVSHKAMGIANRTINQLDIGNKWDNYLINGRPLVEIQLDVPFNIGPFKNFRGTIDWVALEVDSGALWLMDHKVFKSFQPIEFEEWNIQMAAYQFLLHKVSKFPKVVGSILHQIKSELPGEPKLNKNGSMSRQAIATDWQTYKSCLLKANLNPDDYADMASKLSKVEFWKYSRAYRGEPEVEAVWHDIKNCAMDIVGGTRYYRTLSPRVCSNCTSQMLCMEEMRGGDVSFIQNTLYQKYNECIPPFVLPELEESDV